MRVPSDGDAARFHDLWCSVSTLRDKWCRRMQKSGCGGRGGGESCKAQIWCLIGAAQPTRLAGTRDLFLHADHVLRCSFQNGRNLAYSCLWKHNLIATQHATMK